MLNITRKWVASPLFALLLSLPGFSAAAQNVPAGQPQQDSLLAALPAELRPAGAAIIAERDPETKRKLLEKLGSAEPGAGTRARLLETAPFAVALADARLCPEDSGAWKSRVYPCASLVSQAFTQTGDAVLGQTLERWAGSHPDPKIAVWVLNGLLSARRAELSRLLDQRIDLARSTEDTTGLMTLGRAQEGLAPRVASFLWDPPPVFEVKPASARVRVLAIGDSGTGSPLQAAVAAAMLREHRHQPFDFGITLGDNYQDDGPHSPSDVRWEKYWEKWYSVLGIPFYASLGNHDWGNPDGPAASVLYGARNSAWRLPALHYSYTAGPVQFFVVNTPLLSEAQLRWLRDTLGKSTAPWKVVYGHFQIYSALRGDNPTLIAKLLPILKEQQVHMYLCGHEHLFQHLRPEGGVHFFVNGAAGARARAARLKTYPRVLFMAEKKQGFTVLEAEATALTVRFIGQDGKQLYEHSFRK